ncbi:MAG: uroporphyrinogen-III synthase [Gemmatimonadota bacterium]|jgi:uroporphyrinogen III methyltransferase/synthase|nr:uroporphyrinogen-III synthase [Gemmatimonadota bacterium]
MSEGIVTRMFVPGILMMNVKAEKVQSPPDSAGPDQGKSAMGARMEATGERPGDREAADAASRSHPEPEHPAAGGWLDGCRVVVTRPVTESDELSMLLERMGAEVVMLPMIRIEASEDDRILLGEVVRPGGYDWLVFTSVNGVACFRSALDEVGVEWPDARVCAVGPTTASAIRRAGGKVDVVPDEHIAEGAAEVMINAAGGLAGKRVLFPRAEEARPVLADALRTAGAEVVEVVAYRTVAETANVSELRRILEAGEVDVITFASGSAVRAFSRLVGLPSGARTVVASIGPLTSAAARSAGMEVDIEAMPYTAEGLAMAISRYYGMKAPEG